MYRVAGRSDTGGRRCTKRQEEMLQEEDDVQGGKEKCYSKKNMYGTGRQEEVLHEEDDVQGGKEKCFRKKMYSIVR
jgi:hypothetical protein